MIRTRTMSKLLSVVGLFTVTALGLAACSAANSADNPDPADGAIKLRIQTYPGLVASAPVWVAIAEGFAAEEGVEIEEIGAPGGSTATQVLASGDTDFIAVDVPGILLAQQAGLVDMVYIAGQMMAPPVVLGCRPGGAVPENVKYPEAMEYVRNATVAISSPGSATDTLLRYTLIEAGLDPIDSNIIAAGSTQNGQAALESGRVDCLVANDPSSYLLGDKMFPVVNWREGEGPAPAAAGGSIYNGIATTREFATSNPKAIEALSRAMEKAVAYLSDPANATELSKTLAPNFPGLDPKILKEVMLNVAPAYNYEMSDELINGGIHLWNTVHPDNQVDAAPSHLRAAAVSDWLVNGKSD